jgi:hypothetical protein
VRKQTCNKVSITVVSDDQVRVGLKLSSNLVSHVLAAIKERVSKMFIFVKKEII